MCILHTFNEKNELYNPGKKVYYKNVIEITEV